MSKYNFILMNTLTKQQWTEGAGFQKPKNEYPPLDKISTEITYAITINPNPQNQYYMDKLRYEKWHDFMTQVLLPLFNANIKAYIELSTKSQLFHLHGRLSFPSYKHVKKFYMRLPVILEQCTISLKPEDSWEWPAYYLKSQHIFPNPIKFKTTPISSKLHIDYIT